MTDLEIRPEKLNGKYGEKTDQKSNNIVERAPHLFDSTIYFALYKRKKKINFGVIKKNKTTIATKNATNSLTCYRNQHRNNEAPLQSKYQEGW